MLTAVVRGRIFTGICLSVCLSVYPHNISTTAAVTIAKLHGEMLYDDTIRYDTAD